MPFVALLVSGGHTQLVRVGQLGEYELLGESVDDAAGEAFDKTAKLLDFDYPGGPAVAKAAARAEAAAAALRCHRWFYHDVRVAHRGEDADLRGGAAARRGGSHWVVSTNERTARKPTRAAALEARCGAVLRRAGVPKVYESLAVAMGVSVGSYVVQHGPAKLASDVQGVVAKASDVSGMQAELVVMCERVYGSFNAMRAQAERRGERDVLRQFETRDACMLFLRRFGSTGGDLGDEAVASSTLSVSARAVPCVADERWSVRPCNNSAAHAYRESEQAPDSWAEKDQVD